MKPPERKRAAAWLIRNKGVSQRRSCGLMRLHCSTFAYESRRKEPIELKKRLKDHAQERPRRGCRRLFTMLLRDGFQIRISALYRIYCALGLAIRRRKRRRLKGISRAPLEAARRPNERWSMGFVQDSIATAQSIRVLSLVDDCTRESLTVDVGASIPSERVIRSLERVILERGRPGVVVYDNGPEFTSNRILR